MSPNQTPPPIPSMRSLHRPLIGGLAAISSVFLVLRYGLQAGPTIPIGAPATVFAYLTAGVSLVALATALLIFRPRVPQLRPGQSVEEYWAGEPRGLVLLMWVLATGGGVIGASGFLLTGNLVPALATAAAFVVLLTNGPRRFENT